MLKNKEELQEILNLDIEDEEKIEKIAQIKNTETEISRVILTNEKLKLEEGQKISELGQHWKDNEDENASNESYYPDNQLGEIPYLFVVKKAKGFKIQYLDLDYLICELGLEEEEAEEIYEDKTYQQLLELIGSEPEMQNECEILVSNETEFTVEHVSDERDETGFIVVELI